MILSNVMLTPLSPQSNVVRSTDECDADHNIGFWGAGRECLQTAELFEHILAIQCSSIFFWISEFRDLMISSAIELDLVGSWD